MRLKGKTALIGGAGRNNGKAIATTFAREGADLVLISRKRGDELNEVVKECESYGVKVMPVLADLSNSKDVNRVVQEGLAKFGKIDVSVSVMGLRRHKPFWEISDEEWLEVFSVNLFSTFYLAKALAPSMMKQKSGSIIALGGLASMTSQPLRAHVVASKTGLYGLIKSLALELGPYNVRANLIALSLIVNKRLNPEWYAEAGGDPHTLAEIETTALKREGTRDEVAKVALFLASEDSSYVTGDRILCAGGKYM